MTRLLNTLYEDICNFMTLSRSLLLRMINIEDKVIQKVKPHIVGSCYEIMWENVVQPDRPHKKI
jgi:hypothetical protein